MKILVSGGGTGGHISPILATLEELKQLDNELEILYVGTSSGMESKIARAHGLAFKAISAGKYRRYPNRKFHQKAIDLSTMGLNIRDSIRLLKGIFQARQIIKDFEPGVIFLKGGFVGLPVGIAAGMLNVPYVIHESDTLPGLANRYLSKKAARIAVGFPMDKYKGLFPADRMVFTGSPIRSEITKASKADGMKKLALEADVPVMVVTGGSQGSRIINELILDSLPELLKRLQLIFITGERDIERVKFNLTRMSYPADRLHVYPYLTDQMAPALAAADVVVCRAGANTIAELAALGKPAILIPGLHLSDQLLNAKTLARQGACRVIQEDKLRPATLVREVDAIISGGEDRDRLVAHLKEFAKPEASRELAKVIMEVGKEHATQASS